MGLLEDQASITSNGHRSDRINTDHRKADFVKRKPHTKDKNTSSSADKPSKNKMADGSSCSESLHLTEQISKDLAYDIVYYISNLKKLRPSSTHARTLRRTVDELSERHAIFFNSMVKKLEITEENCRETFENVVSEMFRDGQYNWGRLATVYALAGKLAKHCAERNMVGCVDTIADFTGRYVCENLVQWIHRNGGWDAFDEFFPEQPNIENTIWRGLLMTTMFGLGALATMAAVR